MMFGPVRGRGAHQPVRAVLRSADRAAVHADGSVYPCIPPRGRPWMVSEQDSAIVGVRMAVSWCSEATVAHSVFAWAPAPSTPMSRLGIPAWLSSSIRPVLFGPLGGSVAEDGLSLLHESAGWQSWDRLGTARGAFPVSARNGNPRPVRARVPPGPGHRHHRPPKPATSWSPWTATTND